MTFVDGTTEADALSLASSHSLIIQVFSDGLPPSAVIDVPEGDEEFWIGVLEVEAIVTSAEQGIICVDGYRQTGCAP